MKFIPLLLPLLLVSWMATEQSEPAVTPARTVASESSRTGSVNFAFWNLENLFDTTNDPDNPGCRHPGNDFVDPKASQLLFYNPGRADLLETDFRVRVQVAPPFGDVIMYCSDAIMMAVRNQRGDVRHFQSLSNDARTFRFPMRHRCVNNQARLKPTVDGNRSIDQIHNPIARPGTTSPRRRLTTSTKSAVMPE